MKSYWKLLLFSTVLFLLVGCGRSADGSSANFTNFVTFQSSLFAEDNGASISFQLPREWQAGYFADSGYYGWVISNAEPTEAFWYVNRTFGEIVLVAFFSYGKDLLALSSEVKDAALSSGKEPVEFEVSGRIGAYAIIEGEVNGFVFKDGKALEIAGDFPEEQEDDYREGIDMIFKTWDWADASETDLSKLQFLGSRLEGQFPIGFEMEGHVAPYSSSEWYFNGVSDQIVAITIDASDQEVPQIMGSETDILVANLLVDVLDENEESVLPSGLISFSNILKQATVQLSADGVYVLRVYAQEDWYGGYSISLD